MSKLLKLKSGEHNIILDLRSNYTVICGDSATGKSFLYQKLKDAENTEDLILFNYDSVKSKGNYNMAVEAIKNSHEKVFIIDQVDDIQDKDDNMMLAINLDAGTNTFILIGRNPAITYNVSDLAEINITDNNITLQYEFEEPIV